MNNKINFIIPKALKENSFIDKINPARPPDKTINAVHSVLRCSTKLYILLSRFLSINKF